MARDLFCNSCHGLLVHSDASHMLFNKAAETKKDFVSCENPDCSEQNIIVALIKKRKI